VSRAAPLPTVSLIQPVLTQPFHRDGYVYEEKYDGWRIVAYKHGRRVRLVSRRGVDHTKRFAEIAAAISTLRAPTLILDGEVCVFDESLVSRFHFLMEPPADQAITPPVFMAFDCLYVRARDIRPWPLRDRRKVMEDEIDGSPVLPAHRLPEDGLEAWELVKQRGYEGLVAKNERAPYGLNTRWWKVKVRHENRFVVGGIARGESGYVGLLVGRRVGRELRYLGTVEWGVGGHILEDLLEHRRACPRTSSPFAELRRRTDVIWLKPTLRAEISFVEIVGDRLRAPVFRRFV
jgi:bifunctional non-homologous end joining protein LigD